MGQTGRIRSLGSLGRLRWRGWQDSGSKRKQVHQLLSSLQRCLRSWFQTLLQIRVVSRVAIEIWGWGRSLGREGGEDDCSSPARQEPGNSDPVRPQGFWEGGPTASESCCLPGEVGILGLSLRERPRTPNRPLRGPRGAAGGEGALAQDSALLQRVPASGPLPSLLLHLDCPSPIRWPMAGFSGSFGFQAHGHLLRPHFPDHFSV